MEQKNFSKIVYAALFVALAAVSCWATQESLHLSLPSWPQPLCWIVVIAFFVIASFGTKLIVDSFNQNIYVEGRGWKLIFGFIIVILFWLICSMPTNTHTFFYRNSISDKVASDITTTKGYLDQLKNNTVTESKIQAACTKVENEVHSKLIELKAEIMNELNPGDGPEARRIRAEIAEMLHVPKIEALSYNSTSIQDRNRLVLAYRDKIDALLEVRILTIINEMKNLDESTIKILASADWSNLDIIESGIKDGTVDVNNADDINEINNRLSKAYATIKNYRQYVFFNDNDEELYTKENQVSKVKRMISVWDVWADFVNGKYAGHGLIFWVILSILVDLGAFIFFDLAFKKDEYSL